VLNISIFFVDGILQRASPPPEVDETYFDSPRSFDQWTILTMPPIERWGYFSIEKAIYGGQVWRFLTFQFLHASPTHLLFNMLGLYFFGPIVEAQFGTRRYLAFYLGCGLAGAVTFLLLVLGRVLHTAPVTPLVGASAGIFGLLVAAAMIAPDVELFYYFIPVTIRFAAITGMLMAAYAVFSDRGFNAGGEAAHLGGGILGYALMKNQHWLNPFAERSRDSARGGTEAGSSSPRRRRARRYQKDWSKDLNR